MVCRYYRGKNCIWMYGLNFKVGCVPRYLFNYFVLLFQAKFIAVLILVPWLVDFVVHDYVLMPFLDR